MPFSHLRLICPRCRDLDGNGQLIVHPLVCDQKPGQVEARLGELETCETIVCANAQCVARYPVVQGIPIVFANPEAVAGSVDSHPDPLSMPLSTLEALVRGCNPTASLPRLLQRLARHAWAGFRDWLLEDDWPEASQFRIHGVELAAWLASFGEDQVADNGGRGVLGCALGREAWEVRQGSTVLADAHLPSLLAARRLLKEGSLRYLAPLDVTRWVSRIIDVPKEPRVPVALICTDVLDPPWEAEQFGSVICANLIDSVSDPMLLLHQSHALLRSGGSLTVTSPFAWQPNITPQARWLESLVPNANSSAEDALLAIARSDLAPPLSLVSSETFLWALRNRAREIVVYRNLAVSFSKAQ